ncbi:hypothetical protein L6R53_02295 [Myxococcota bacterium]|nr:hypothetical protein [Myxococcota bacterium]
MITLLPLLLACAPQRDCSPTVWFVDDGSAGRVEVVGAWSGFATEPLEPVEPGAWALGLDLPPGDHPYWLLVDGARTLDLLQPLLDHDPGTGQERSLLRVEDCSDPAIELEQVQATAHGELTVQARFLRGQGGARLDPSTLRAELSGGQPLTATASPSTGRLALTATGLPPGKHTIRLSAQDRDGRTTQIARAATWVEDDPFSWDGALVYQVVIDRFADQDGPIAPQGWQPDRIGSRMGGDLAGLTAQVQAGWFDALGVSALWISPLARVAPGAWPGNDGHDYEGYHGYWPVSADQVEPAFGDEASVHALVAAAHARGIRVILDVVPNHVHQDHPYRQAFQDQGWFHEDPDCVCGSEVCPWSEAMETCWFTPYLPDLDWDQPAVVQAMTADTLAWATRYDLDGFRVDAVPMVSRVAVRHLVQAVRTELAPAGAPFYLVGETFTGTQGWADIRKNLGPHGLDGQFDFPVMWGLRELLAWESGDAAAFEDILAESEDQWAGSGAVMAPFVGNHDVSRFLSEAAGDETGDPWGAPPPQPEDAAPYDKLVAAQAIVLSLPGAPVIYQGDELGLAGATDPDSRRPMPWGAALSALQAQTLERVRLLGRARACLPALRTGARVPLLAEGPGYAHARDLGDGRPAVLVVNASATERRLSIPLPPTLDLGDGAYVDVLDGGAPAVLVPGDRPSVHLPAWGARLYLPADTTCDLVD